MEGRIEVSGRRGIKRKQLLDDIKEKSVYWKLKQEALVLQPPKKRRWSDVSQILSGQGVDQTSLLRKSEGVVMSMQCNCHRLPLIVFTNN